MSEPFKQKYEFDTHAHLTYREPHTVICADAQKGSSGEGSVRFWIEIRHPESYDFEDGGKFIPARTETILGETIYSWDLIHDRDKREFSEEVADFLMREIVLALARGEVAGKSASSMMWTLLSQTAVKKRSKWLREGAPDWFKLVDPRREENVSQT